MTTIDNSLVDSNLRSSNYLLPDVDNAHWDSWVLRPILPARFFRKVRFDVSGCWIWTGAYGFHPRYRQHRYGQIVVWNKATQKRRITTAHKFAYLHVKGNVPKGFDVDHLCGVKLCVNPQHLEAVSHQENIRRIPAGGGTFCRIGGRGSIKNSLNGTTRLATYGPMFRRNPKCPPPRKKRPSVQRLSAWPR